MKTFFRNLLFMYMVRRGWRASENGNPTFSVLGLRIALFELNHGWSFSIGSVEEKFPVYFCPKVFDTEVDAKFAAAKKWLSKSYFLSEKFDQGISITDDDWRLITSNGNPKISFGDDRITVFGGGSDWTFCLADYQKRWIPIFRNGFDSSSGAKKAALECWRNKAWHAQKFTNEEEKRLTILSQALQRLERIETRIWNSELQLQKFEMEEIATDLKDFREQIRKAIFPLYGEDILSEQKRIEGDEMLDRIEEVKAHLVSAGVLVKPLKG